MIFNAKFEMNGWDDKWKKKITCILDDILNIEWSVDRVWALSLFNVTLPCSFQYFAHVGWLNNRKLHISQFEVVAFLYGILTQDLLLPARSRKENSSAKNTKVHFINFIYSKAYFRANELSKYWLRKVCFNFIY